jgi:hypothetical protein
VRKAIPATAEASSSAESVVTVTRMVAFDWVHAVTVFDLCLADCENPSADRASSTESTLVGVTLNSTKATRSRSGGCSPFRLASRDASERRASMAVRTGED